MLKTSLTFGLAKFDRATLDLEHRQMPFALMLSLNETAKGARKEVQSAMGRVFDRVTPFARRGVVYERASKTDLDASVVIHGFKSPHGGLPAAYFLGPQVHGGQRSLKAFEVQLRERGLLPAGHVVVPGERLKLDRYGNISQGMLNRILSRLQIDYRGAGATRVASTKKRRARNKRGSKSGFYFVPGKGSHLAPGVWFEPGFPARAIYPVLLFVKQRGYRVRLPMEAIVSRYAAQSLPRNFERAWRRVIRTAR